MPHTCIQHFQTLVQENYNMSSWASPNRSQTKTLHSLPLPRRKRVTLCSIMNLFLITKNYKQTSLGIAGPETHRNFGFAHARSQQLTISGILNFNHMGHKPSFWYGQHSRYELRYQQPPLYGQTSGSVSHSMPLRRRLYGMATQIHIHTSGTS